MVLIGQSREIQFMNGNNIWGDIIMANTIAWLMAFDISSKYQNNCRMSIVVFGVKNSVSFFFVPREGGAMGR